MLAAALALAAFALGSPPALGEGAEAPPRGAQQSHRCALSEPRSPLGMTLRGCRVVFSDTAAEADPGAVWGQLACASERRQSRPRTGGDPAPRADGRPQGDRARRLLRVLDGDDFYGERCELGRNDHRQGPTALYAEGVRHATYASVRLPPSFPLDTPAWQNVLQIKQAQPADNGGGTPALSLKAFDGDWILFHSDPGPTEVDTPLWSAPARLGVWTRFALDVSYSSDPDRGTVKAYADLDGDGDFSDAGEESPTFITNTLKRETAGSPLDGYSEGDSLASHLRAGIYHDPEVPCPAPAGCAVELDNVQIVAP